MRSYARVFLRYLSDISLLKSSDPSKPSVADILYGNNIKYLE